MRYSAIKYCDIANGTGVRTSLFVSGCRLHCPGCFNQEAQSFDSGELFTKEVENAIIESITPHYIAGLTILGGEPMEPENQEGLAPFLTRIKQELPEKDIWLFSGYTLENLLDETSPQHTPYTLPLLQRLDVLVDGPFRTEEADITLRFRGSVNQRLIDVGETLKHGNVVPHKLPDKMP